VLWLILSPLYRPPRAEPAFVEPEDPEETRRGIALIALKEIDFDRATGKLSEPDYLFLKQKYTVEALQAIAEDERGQAGPSVDGSAGSLSCPRCGAAAPAGARFCGECGSGLTDHRLCRNCQAPLEPGSRFCGGCGTQVVAAA
jgi:predicted nucleic acid-binding Zn ribbon protein